MYTYNIINTLDMTNKTVVPLKSCDKSNAFFKCILVPSIQ